MPRIPWRGREGDPVAGLASLVPFLWRMLVSDPRHHLLAPGRTQSGKTAGCVSAQKGNGSDLRAFKEPKLSTPVAYTKPGKQAQSPPDDKNTALASKPALGLTTQGNQMQPQVEADECRMQRPVRGLLIISQKLGQLWRRGLCARTCVNPRTASAPREK